MERKGPSFSIPSHYSFVFLSSLSENRLSCLFQFGPFERGVNPWGARPLLFIYKNGRGLTLAILFAVRVLLSTGAAPSLGNMMLPAGAESGPSTAFPKLEWEVALDLPSQSGGA